MLTFHEKINQQNVLQATASAQCQVSDSVSFEVLKQLDNFFLNARNAKGQYWLTNICSIS